MKKRLLLGATLLLLIAGGSTIAATSPDRLKNSVLIGDGVAGTKYLSFDIGGSNPLIESISGVLKLSTDGSALMTVPAATDTIVGKATTDTLTNKTLSDTTTVIGYVSALTKALKFDLSGATTGKTATITSSHTDNRTLTLPDITDTLVGKTTTDTLTNKTLTTPIIGSAGATFNGSSSGTTILKAAAAAGSTTVTLPAATDTLVALATTDTLTNKTLTSPKINEAVALTTTATKLNYLTSAAGTTGTASTNIVYSTSPTIATPALTGAWTATGDLTATNSSGIGWLLTANGTAVTNKVILRTGNGTTSSENSMVEFDSAESAGQTWDIGFDKAVTGDNSFAIVDQTAGIARIDVSALGAVTIGTNSTGYTGTHSIHGSPTDGTATSTTLHIRNSDTTATSDDNALIYMRKGSTTNSSSQIFVRFAINSGSTASGNIVGNGANAAAFASSSDRRLKRNIADVPTQLAKFRALKPREFDYKDGSGHQTGFVAQEMQEVYPDAVSTDAATGMLQIVGWSKTESRLVKAMQELDGELQNLKTEFGAYKKAHPDTVSGNPAAKKAG